MQYIAKSTPAYYKIRKNKQNYTLLFLMSLTREKIAYSFEKLEEFLLSQKLNKLK